MQGLFLALRVLLTATVVVFALSYYPVFWCAPACPPQVPRFPWGDENFIGTPYERQHKGDH